MKTFEDYLKDVHCEDYLGCDDDMPDAFDDFISNIDVEDMCTYADEYGEYCRIFGATEAVNQANSLATNIN